MKAMVSGIACLCVALANTCMGATTQVLMLAERGSQALPIVTRAHPTPLEQYAAEEWCAWTEKLTGVRPAILRDDKALPDAAIVLGETRHAPELLGVQDLSAQWAQIGSDGYRIVVKGNRLVLFASSKRGALYAVYDVLERYGGIGWFSSWHTVVPKSDRFAIPRTTDYCQKPAFLSREPFWYDVRMHPKFAARLRVNAQSWGAIHPRLGIGEYRFGGGLGSCHTFNTLCSPEKYFDAHPEWFSEVKGKRVKKYTQLCLTNPDVLEVVVSNVLKAIKSDPTATYFGVSQNDWLNACTCAKCKAIDEEEGSHAGTMVRFVNAVAERVEKIYPDKIIETLAYQYTRKPPKKARLRHNVMPCLCTIECDFFHPIPESKLAETKQFSEIFKGWSALTDQLYVWDYVTNFKEYTQPFPNIYALQGNIKFFRDNKVVSLFEQGSYQGNHGDMAELKAWLVAKWMWNPDLPLEPLLDTFCKGYYGAGAPFVRTYLKELHDREAAFEAKGGTPLKIYRSLNQTCLDDAFLKRATHLWDQASAAVAQADECYRKNVRTSRLGVDCARLYRNSRLVWVTQTPERFIQLENPSALARDALACIDAGKVRLSEGASSHEAFYNQIKALAAAGVACVTNRALAPVCYFHHNIYAKRVKDPTALNGEALAIQCTHHEWSGTWPLSALAYDTNAFYRVRFHVRTKRPKAVKTGEVFWAGVYDPVAKRGLCADIRCKANAVSAKDWFWCQTPPFKPNDNAYLWLAPGIYAREKYAKNPACDEVFVDAFEIVREP